MGNPKGAIISHQTMLSLELSINQHYKISFTPDDVIIAYLPLAHMFERFVEANALMNGACIGYWRGSVRDMMSDLCVLRPTAFCAVPRILQRIESKIMDSVKEKGRLVQALFQRGLASKLYYLKDNVCTSFLWDHLVFKRIAAKCGLDRCRWILTGSAPISDSIVNRVKCVFSCALLNGYGMTESGGGTCCSSSMDYCTVGHCGGPVCGIEGKLVSVPEKNYYYTDKVHFRDAGGRGARR